MKTKKQTPIMSERNKVYENYVFYGDKTNSKDLTITVACENPLPPHPVCTFRARLNKRGMYSITEQLPGEKPARYEPYADKNRIWEALELLAHQYAVVHWNTRRIK